MKISIIFNYAISQQKLYDEYPFLIGFTVNLDISDIVESKTFRVATEKSKWNQVMVEEIEALQK